MLDYYSGTRHPSEPSPDVKATAEEQNEQLSRSAKRQLKIAELVRAKSAEAQAIFITIPVYVPSPPLAVVKPAVPSLLSSPHASRKLKNPTNPTNLA
jgi:hypothetical protein